MLLAGKCALRLFAAAPRFIFCSFRLSSVMPFVSFRLPERLCRFTGARQRLLLEAADFVFPYSLCSKISAMRSLACPSPYGFLACAISA